MANDQQGVINLIRSISGQANILTIPRVFIDLTGDLKAALFLSQCIYWSSRSSEPGVFYKTYQEWEKELGLGRREIDHCRKVISRWVKTELRHANRAPVLHYIVLFEALAQDLLDLMESQKNKDVQTISEQIHLYKSAKSNCTKGTNGFGLNVQIESRDIKGINLTETTLTEITAEINSNGFAAADRFAHQKTKRIKSNDEIPPEIKDTLKRLGWRGSLADVEKAWQADPERVRQWLWYAGKQGWNGALLRTVLRNDGEYPPELDPSSDHARRRYLEGPYADFIEH